LAAQGSYFAAHFPQLEQHISLQGAHGSFDVVRRFGGGGVGM
jgi:hypothetical protein